MTRFVTARLLVSVLIATLSCWFWLQPAHSQTPVPAPNSGNDTPLLADGTVNLGSVGDDKGVWELFYRENMANYVVEPAADGSLRPAVTFPGDVTRRSAAAEPHVPFMPWSAAIYDYHTRTRAKYDPEGYCLPPGGPRLFTAPYPMKIIQLPDQQRVIFLFEAATHIWREVYTDGRPHPPASAIKGETWLGNSVGHYEDGGKTFVVDVTGFNEGTWLDFAGHPHTNMLHIVEKFSRPRRDTLRYEVTIDDPGAYTRPWKAAWNAEWWAGGELDEYICQENNQYLKTLKDDRGQPIFRPND